MRRSIDTIGWTTGLVGSGVIGGIILSIGLVGLPAARQPAITGPLSLEYLDLAAQRSMSDAAWWMVVITGISVLAGGASIVLIAMTLYQAKRSADAAVEAVKHAEATTAAATLSASHAASAVEVTREMGKKQVRAYMAVTNVTILPVTDSEENYFNLAWRLFNAGQSPARRLKFVATAEVQVLREGRWETEDREFVTRFLADLPANQGIDDVRDFALTIDGDVVDAFNDYAGRFVVHGQVNYVDVFGDNWSEPFRFSKQFNDEEDWTEGAALPREPSTESI